MARLANSHSDYSDDPPLFASGSRKLTLAEALAAVADGGLSAADLYEGLPSQLREVLDEFSTIAGTECFKDLADHDARRICGDLLKALSTPGGK